MAAQCGRGRTALEELAAEHGDEQRGAVELTVRYAAGGVASGQLLVGLDPLRSTHPARASRSEAAPGSPQ